jgi:hypothetical protein
MHYCYYPKVDENFWERATSINFGDIETKTLQPLDMLLHVCVHGSRWNSVPPMRWIVDAMMILKMMDENTNWQLLIEEVKARHFVVPMRFMLEHLKVEYGAAIPNEVLQELSTTPVRNFERLQYRIANKALNSGQVMGSSLAILLAYYRHQTLNHKTVLEIMNPLALVSYLQGMLNCSSIADALRWMCSRLLVRTANDVKTLLRR